MKIGMMIILPMDPDLMIMEAPVSTRYEFRC